MTNPEPPPTTPEGHTPEEPSASEMAAVAHHDAATHMDAHTTLGDDDHGHAEPRLGPIDWQAWSYAALGTVAGVLAVAFFWYAIT